MENIYNIYVGIDPGQSGCMACLSEGGLVLGCHPLQSAPQLLPKLIDKAVDPLDVAEWLEETVEKLIHSSPAMLERVIVMNIMIEAQSPRPVQGVKAAFQMGLNFHALCAGVLEFIKRRGGDKQLVIRVRSCTPTQWYKLHGIKAGTDSKTKKLETRLLASSLFGAGNTIRDDGVADALLIAEYARKTA